jgi:molybdopterin-containing oxidoreductase family iron-sulfur binding subunit
MSSNKKYWKSVEELDGNSSIVEALKNNEFVEEIPTDEFLGNGDALSSSSTTRRDFLKYVGFSTAAATLAACEGPVHKSIPYVLQPEQIIPGVADYYATSVFDGFDFANLLVKTREGRPIKVDNNTIAGAKFTANARVHASILSLYDSMRLKEPKIAGTTASWTDVNSKISSSVAEAKSKGGQVVLLTNTLASPSTEKLISEFLSKNPNAKHIVYDAVSSSEALDAFETVYGERALVDYDFSKASLIVSVGADFLGDWQGGGYGAGYAQGRIPRNGKMSRHFQLEANMTLSGAAADKRLPMSTANQKQALIHIYNIITGSSVAVSLDDQFKSEVTKAAQQLKASGSKGVLVSGIQDKNAQLLVLAINQKLASEAFITSGTRQIRKGSNEKVTQLINEMKAGSIHTLIMSGVNPVYTLADSASFVEGLKKVTTSVSFSLKEDETASLTTVAAPVPHYLESWNDLALTKGTYSLTQPTIRPLFNTQQFQETLLHLNGISGTFYDYIKGTAASIIVGSTWNKVLHDGVYVYVGAVPSVSASPVDYVAAATTLSKSKAVEGLELVLYTKTGLGDGQQANNPWLQEFPDPITRVSWDNYVTVSYTDANKLGLTNEIVANGGLNGSYATITLNDGATLENVPVIVQPGQAIGTVGLALGYGRKASLKEEMAVGVNAYTLYKGFNNVQSVSLIKTDGEHEFACVQGQKTLMGRGDIIKETTLEIFNTKDAKEWNEVPVVSLDHKEVEATKVDLWDSFDRSVGHHFNLSIDLNACTGCGACVIACHAENNVPVVGKSEVRRSRDMHWLRIDRYYSSESTFEGDNERKENIAGLTSSLSTFNEMEKAGDNPQVAFQPVMCQHCNHAPCETVCPVAATSHSRQGQNNMAYNRCVGTRYCANNCPYKVRRFNWFLYSQNSEFDYHMNDDLGRMVLNPDVNVRSRGVMEKCSMCIQMTQATILKAKREGRAIKDGEFQTACSNACSTGAMVFGDVNDTEAKITKLAADDRMYHLLEHVGTKPNVIYHVKVRNT